MVNIYKHPAISIFTGGVELVENAPSVMLVHPHGCIEMENIVVFLASQLNTFGVNVYLDILQTQKIANEGLSKVLLDNYREADYVALLCMEGMLKINFYFYRKNCQILISIFIDNHRKI